MHSKTEKERQIADGRGWGKGSARSRITRPQESMALYKSLNTLWLHRLSQSSFSYKMKDWLTFPTKFQEICSTRVSFHKVNKNFKRLFTIKQRDKIVLMGAHPIILRLGQSNLVRQSLCPDPIADA